MKVLIIQDTIPHYRVPVFNALSEKVNLTLMYNKGKISSNVKFKTIICKVVTLPKIGQFPIVNLYQLYMEYDVIIAPFAPGARVIELLQNKRKKNKLIYWGIGVLAGYDLRYDKNNIYDKKYIKMLENAAAGIFYSDYPVNKYMKLGIEKNKLFVANNTVEILKCFEEKEKDTIIFVGSLYKQKKIYELLENYERAHIQNNEIFNLIIIGDGDEYSSIQKWIESHYLSNKIFLVGGIYEEKILASYFLSAIVCISPDQAGLSVLKSMGYGVPYITHKNAITGGEIFNIHDGIDGILLNDFNEIESVILESFTNKEKFISMGKKAKQYYDNNRTLENMVNGFVSAINFVCSSEEIE